MRNVALSIAMMLKYPNILFEDNVLTLFWIKSVGRKTVPPLEPLKPPSQTKHWQSSDALVVTEPESNIRDVNEQCHLTGSLQNFSTFEFPHYLIY